MLKPLTYPIQHPLHMEFSVVSKHQCPVNKVRSKQNQPRENAKKCGVQLTLNRLFKKRKKERKDKKKPSTHFKAAQRVTANFRTQNAHFTSLRQILLRCAFGLLSRGHTLFPPRGATYKCTKNSSNTEV